MTSSGIYIHIPFCKSLCPYCDFYKIKQDKELMQKYTEAVVKTTASFSHEYKIESVDTIYFGGGTPSCMDGDQIVKILNAVKENFNVRDDSEITVECNPSSDLEVFIPKIAKSGVNRISLGMQSAVDGERKSLGRMADRERVKRAIEICRENGISNISLDIMFGVPGQTMDSLKDTLSFCIDMDVPHISAYILKLEEGTVFYNRKDTLDLPSEDIVCDMYNLCVDTLNSAGVLQYEISNFSKIGYESKHNLKYWRDEEYLGIGPSAHSFVLGKRFYISPDINSFLEGTSIIPDGEGGDISEKIMLGLRLVEGVIVPEYLIDKIKKDKELMSFVNINGNNISLKEEGYLVSNVLIGKIIELI